MSGTFQLFFYILLLGASLGVGIGVFQDLGWMRLLPAGFFWAVFVFHLADAFWSFGSPRGREWEDRIGILIRGLGFALIAISVLLTPSLPSLILGISGVVTMMFGRIFWELILARRPKNKQRHNKSRHGRA